MLRTDIEIMAPAGNFDSLYAAIQGGADSVYFGVGSLNMRSRSANNFTIEDLDEIVSLCRSHGIKTYLTVNTVLFDEDIPAMKALIDAAYRADVSAIIASDQAAIMYAKEIGVEIHLSTQINISNFESLRFYAPYADVAVLARELNLEQVAKISEQIHLNNLRGPKGDLIRLEMFAHGALCMATSGKCYLSLHENNKSANRGSCLQICRRSYLVIDKETGQELEVDNEYIMSPKDLCTIDFLDKMIKAGVRVLKIEGRARSAEYVRTVVECYGEAVEAFIQNEYTPERIGELKKRLATVFNRGFWGGYYLGKTLGEWTTDYGNRATRKKTQIGKVTNFFSNLMVAEIVIESGQIKTGDKILITGPTTGAVETELKEIRVDLQITELAAKGDRCSVELQEKVRRGDKVFLMEDIS